MEVSRDSRTGELYYYTQEARRKVQTSKTRDVFVCGVRIEEVLRLLGLGFDGLVGYLRMRAARYHISVKRNDEIVVVFKGGIGVEG